MSRNPAKGTGAARNLREIFTAALACDDARVREQLLEHECNGDDVLRGKVELLLEESTMVGDFLERPAVEDPTRGSARAEAMELPGEGPGDVMGPYRLIDLVGEGGGGSVYRAEQQDPVQRTVALKILKLGMDTRSIIRRFETERQALAVMDHPHIAKVLDAGASPDGRPYFVMDLVEGEPITGYCDTHSLPVKSRVALLIKVCRAVEHAHQKGIIHRDLKPSNILIVEQDGEAAPKVIDFGVAKAIDPFEEDRSLTLNDTVIGTPAYMSPEQAERDRVDIDTRSDVYSLGVLLYELLTGYTPLDGGKVKEAGIDELRQALREAGSCRPSLKLRHSRVEDRPRIGLARGTSIGRLEIEVQGDLDWIVMKSLERDRSRRYGGASELAADMERYLQGLPVEASPPSTSDRLRKFARRHRTVVTAAALLLLMLIAGVIISTGQALRAIRAEREMREAHRQKSIAHASAMREREEAVRSEATARLHEYVADINVGYHAVEDGHIAKALSLLEGQLRSDPAGELRGFEWRYLASRCMGVPHRTLPRQGSPVSTLSFSPDGDLLAVGTRHEVLVWDLSLDELKMSVPGPATTVVFLSRGERLVVGNRSGVVIYNCESGEVVHELEEQGGGGAAILSPRGDVLATSGRGSVTLWETGSWQPIRRLPDVAGPLAFSPDGMTLATGSREGIVLWSLGEDHQVTLYDSAVPLSGFFPGGTRILFSPDGATVLAPHVEKSELGVFYLGTWDAVSGEELGVLPASPADEGHSGMITSLSADWEGQVLASSSWDHSVRLWDLETRRLLRTLHGHRGEVWCTALSPHGGVVASGSKDGEVKIWPTSGAPEAEAIVGQWKPLSFSRDSRYVGALNREGGVAIMNLETRKMIHQLEVSSSDRRFPRYIVAFTDDLTALAEALPEGGVKMRKLGKKETVMTFASGSSRIDRLALAPDSSTMVTVGWRDDLAWWDLTDTSEPIKRISGRQAVFSADGGTLATVTRDGYSIIWDTATRRERLRIEHGGQSLGSSVAVSPDGTILALTYGIDDFENTVSLWDTSTGEHLGTLPGHKQTIWSVAFSPDGRTLASSSADGTLRLWNVASQRELMSIDQGGSSLAHLRFSPDGTFLVAGTPPFSNSGQIRIIHAPPIRFDDPDTDIIP